MLGTRVVTRADCEELLSDLASLPLSEREAVPGLHPARAPAIVAGLAIHLELLTAIGSSSFTVCERDLRHGVALALASEI
jgi:exopolyphosphatase/guanosine-5'-triphosphate,3'-diphosphate pyrophosphatase